MLNQRNAAFASLAVVGFLLVLTLGDFLALHDIQQDYVSPEVLNRLKLDIAGSLPYWTATSGEWAMVTISFIARVILLLGNVLLLFMILRRDSKSDLQ
jgi:hypothetical protein